MNKERDAVILKKDSDNQDLLYSKEKAMKYVIQRENNNSSNLHKNFDEK